jgi:ATP-dependent helicase Lhr and Lhr-like helicase
LADHLRELGWSAPTTAQKVAYEPIRDGKNVLLTAPTGHGKTEAALIPVLDRFLHERQETLEAGRAWPPGIKILWVTPLRALNRDMLNRMIGWGESLGLEVGVRHGDTSQSERAKQARRPPEMLITTPETLQILFTGSRLRQHLKTVRWVIVDEVHELAEGERGAQFAVALERLERVVWEGRLETRDAWPPQDAEFSASGQVIPPIPKKTLNGFQRIGLSATIGDPKDVAAYVAGLDREIETLFAVADKQYDIRIETPQIQDGDEALSRRILTEPKAAAMLRRIDELIEKNNAVLLFTNTRDGAEILGTRYHLWKPEHPVGVHHGSLSRDARIEAEEAYKQGRLKALLCTSSLELGIDVGQTDLVIQINSPRGIDRLLQRIGRAGHRAGETSRGVVLCTSGEEYLEAAALARAANARELPPRRGREVPLVVLANQVIATTQEQREMDTAWLHDLLTRTHPFRGLKREVLDSVVAMLGAQGTVWHEPAKGRYGSKGTSRRTFLENISMIPDERSFAVVDVATRRSIGRLDEAFVLASIEPGSHFVLRGRPWTVVEVKEDAILVAPIKDVGNVPRWVGEDLPVRHETAMEVGSLRRRLAQGETDHVIEEYRLKKEHLQEVLTVLDKQNERGLKVPSDTLATLETTSGPGNRILVINGTWGSQVNETLGRLIAALLATRRGTSVGLTTDAYRITLEASSSLHPPEVQELLETTDPDTLPQLLRLVLKNSSTVKWQLVHVARKFGALSREIDPSRFSMRTLLERFADLPLYQEALDKLIFERMDVENAAEILRRIQNKQIALHVQRLSPVARMGIESRKDLMAPKRADRTILETLRNRLLETPVVLRCTNCRHRFESPVKSLPQKPSCPKCKAIMLAAVHPYRKEALGTLGAQDRTQEEEKEAKRLFKIANLVATYGKPALMVLSGRGIGPDAAARILGRMHEDEYVLLAEILEAELTYARTRGFWDR